MTLDWAELAAREFEPKVRRWATPGVMAADLDGTTRQTPALDVIDAALVEVADGDTDKCIVMMPPQEGKSQRVTRRYPLWLLVDNPRLRIVIVSYEQETATRWGRQIKRDIEEHPELGLHLREDSKAAARWETEQGGGIYCVGINGSFTGKPADVLIIDDPLKDRQAAESKLIRDRCWEWWENVAKVRSKKVVLVLTRWHVDDLAGRLIKNEPGEWREVKIPAVAESDDDVLGRRTGEEMRSAQNRKPGYFRKLATSLSTYVWLSLFQQRPTAAEGNLFKRGDWRYWSALGPHEVRLDLTGDGRTDADHYRLAECMRFMTIDLAASTKRSADFTVAAAWAITPRGDLLLLGRAKERVETTGHFTLADGLRARWLQQFDPVYVEQMMHTATFVKAAGRAGWPIYPLQPDTDKVTRALPYAQLVKQRRVFLPVDAEWLDDWQGEHADFPNTKNDDQVDSGSYAAMIGVTHWNPLEDEHVAERRRLDMLAAADSPNDVDLMTSTW